MIPDRLFAAINLTYDFGRARDYATGMIVDGSELGLNAAATARLLDWLYVGGEVRYLRAYDSLAFGNLVGQAVYLGRPSTWRWVGAPRFRARGICKPGVKRRDWIPDWI